MAKPQLSVSTRARDLAHRLARREKRTIADILKRWKPHICAENRCPSAAAGEGLAEAVTCYD